LTQGASLSSPRIETREEPAQNEVE
jgi:hypothetical protein